jgi:hypothetical protein
VCVRPPSCLAKVDRQEKQQKKDRCQLLIPDATTDFVPCYPNGSEREHHDAPEKKKEKPNEQNKPNQTRHHKKRFADFFLSPALQAEPRARWLTTLLGRFHVPSPPQACWVLVHRRHYDRSSLSKT